MASSTAKITFRIMLLIVVALVLFPIGRPLYWKLSETLRDFRFSRRSVSQGISHIVMKAQKSVGWYIDESDSGGIRVDNKANSAAAARRVLFKVS